MQHIFEFIFFNIYPSAPAQPSPWQELNSKIKIFEKTKIKAKLTNTWPYTAFVLENSQESKNSEGKRETNTVLFLCPQLR